MQVVAGYDQGGSRGESAGRGAGYAVGHLAAYAWVSAVECLRTRIGRFEGAMSPGDGG